MMKSSIFSVERANKMLPLIRSIADNIVDSWNLIVKERRALEKLEKDSSEDSIKKEKIMSAKLFLNNIIDKINNYIKEIEALGVFVAEFKRGVLHFPALYHGRKVFLNYIHTEDEEVTYWHEMDEVASDRVKITKSTKESMNIDD